MLDKVRSLLPAVVMVVAAGACNASPDPAAIRASWVQPVAVFIGDSYTAGAGATGAGKGFTSIISLANGWKEVNLARGGTGYVSPVADPRVAPIGCGKAYCPSYTEVIAEAAAANPELVIVNGGRNEVRRATPEWAAGVDAFYVALRAAVPRARIVATSPIWDDDPVPAALPGMRVVVQRAVTAVGGEYVDLGDPLLKRRDYVAADAIHPNDAGHVAIAGAFAAAFKN